MDIDKKDIEQYLSEVKEAVRNDRYRIDRNAKRQEENRRWQLWQGREEEIFA